MSRTDPYLSLPDDEDAVDTVDFVFDLGLNRRRFVQVLGAGLVIFAPSLPGQAQSRQGQDRDGGGGPVAARLHIAEDGTITVLTGKVEMGQGARAELSQAAAEELGVPAGRIRMLMADTAAVPDDGITAGSRSTPSTVPAIRRASAAARQLLLDLAARRWSVEPASLDVRDGTITHAPSQRTLTYADLARAPETAETLKQQVPRDVVVTPMAGWRVLGRPFARPNGRDLVTGAHAFPSDQIRPGMLRGKVLRPPSYGAKLISVDLAPAQAMAEVVAVRDGDFVGVAAPTAFRANRALEAISATARWEPAPHPSSKELFGYLRERAQGGIPKNPFDEQLAGASRTLRATYEVPYVQHAPMEPRVALAEWDDGRLTVWTGTQNPFGYVGELTRAFRLPRERVRVVVPDFGAGFGGKHSGEAAVEAARLAQGAKRPVLLCWTREEEFEWAYFRPAGLIEAEATLDPNGRLTSWHFVNVNSGRSAVETPYRAGQNRSVHVASDSPLRQGSYRALAATANTFAREIFMDELAVAAGEDPLEFRLNHLDEGRLRAVLEEAARRFGWRDRIRERKPGSGIGMACGTEKGSFVAGCAEIEVTPDGKNFAVRKFTEVFECGAILNPGNLVAQVQGGIVMGLGPALREEMEFANGRMRNPRFSRYLVPRFKDLPELDIHLLDRPDLPSVGGGETPIIAVAPAVANAVFHATGRRLRRMPLRLDDADAA